MRRSRGACGQTGPGIPPLSTGRPDARAGGEATQDDGTTRRRADLPNDLETAFGGACAVHVAKKR